MKRRKASSRLFSVFRSALSAFCKIMHYMPIEYIKKNILYYDYKKQFMTITYHLVYCVIFRPAQFFLHVNSS